MTLLDMQRVMSRILTDKKFLSEFMAGAVPDPGTYQLSQRELDSLRGLRWDRVSLHAELLAHGRLELAIKALPLTSLLLHGQLHKQLDRFCAEYPPVPRAAGALYTEAGRLCEFSLRLLDEGVLQPVWAADIISYEHTLLTLVLDTGAAAASTLIHQINEVPLPGDITQAVPVAGAHIRILSFGCPLPDLLPQLDEGVIPDSVPSLDEPLLVLFHKIWHGPVEMIKVNAPVVALIEACDGQRTVADVTALLKHRFGAGTDTQIAQAIDWLRGSGVIALRKAS
jgi:hypothetical protein